MREALEVLPGVGQVEVSFDEKLVRVQLSDGSDSALLLDALKKANYGAEIVSTPSAASGESAAAASDKVDPSGVTYSMQPFAEHVKVSAVLDAEPLHPGDDFRIAVIFDVQEGWHIYGNPVGPGIGRATTVSAEASANVKFAATLYSPGVKAEQDFGDENKTWVWESRGHVVHYIPGKLSTEATIGSTTWIVKAKAQACTETECLPATIKIPLHVQITSPTTKKSNTHENEFTQFGNSRSL